MANSVSNSFIVSYASSLLTCVLAIQLARLSGFSPIITTSSESNVEYCKAAGATHVADYHAIPYSSLPEVVAGITSTPVSYIFDSISSEDSQEACWKTLAPNGQLVVTLQPVVGQPGTEAEDGKRSLLVFGNVNVDQNKEFGMSLYSKLTALLKAGAIKVCTATFYEQQPTDVLVSTSQIK